MVLPTCPGTETPNEDSCFTPGSTAKFYFFLRNETIGDTVYERIINPDGSTFTSWRHNSINSYLSSYWYFNKVLPTIPGVYTYETIYNGTTCTKTFKVNCIALGVEKNTNEPVLDIYPNPAQNTISVSINDLSNEPTNLTIKNLLGQVVYNDKLPVNNNHLAKEIDLKNLSCGVYLISLESNHTRIIKKFVKQ